MLCSPWAISDEPDLVSVAKLMEKFRSTKDTSYAAHIAERCTAHLAIAAQMVPELTPDAESASRGAFFFRKLQAMERGTEFDPEPGQSRVNGYIEWYGARLKNNQETTGDMWVEDAWLVEELQQCRQFVRDASFVWSTPILEGLEELEGL